MDMLNFSDHIICLRRKKGITQEELADFVGVTKASVSKWETKQSLPDIMMLPRLAAFFDVSIDELLGYQPQLGREQIQKIYRDFAADFAKLPFEEVMEKSRVMVKKYYACFPFLFQICVLWMNHFMLAKGQERQMEVLEEAADLCQHIISDCTELGICNDAVILKATIDLQCGRACEVIETLEEMLNPCRLFQQSDACLMQAYQLAGEMEKADHFAQISMFVHLMNLVSGATQYLAVHVEHPEICEETVRRVDGLMDIFGVNHLHANVAAGFQYQAAIVYCMQGKTEKALERLEKYEENILYLMRDDEHLKLHGDSYFPALDRWFEKLDLGADAPRDKEVIWDGIAKTMCHPAFAILEKEKVFQRIKKTLGL